MNPKILAAALGVAVAIAAGGPALAKVSVVQSPSAALAKGSSYAWPPLWALAAGAPTPAIVNEITAQQLQAATDSALAAKGYQRLEDPAQADLIVTYRVITAPRVEGSLNGWGHPGPFFGGSSDYSLTTSQKMQGILVLDLIERQTGRLVYRATSEKDISSKDIEPERLSSLLKDMTKPLPSQ
jgi:hypothetical protein